MTNDHWNWLKQRARPILCGDTIGITAVNHKSEIMAVVAMDSWAPNSCQVHWAIEDKNALRHGFIEEICEFVYVTRSRELLIGLVPANNEKAIKLNKHIGLEEVYRIKDGYNRGVDYVIMQMHRKNCRWLTQEAA